MKRGFTIAGILFILLIAGSACHRFGRRPMRDHMAMYMRHDIRHHGWGPGMGGMFHGRQSGMMRSQMMRPGMGFGMMGNMGRMGNDSTSFMPFGPGRRILESIPNVTETQKKQIEDIIKKQHDDMLKLREEMSSKMKDIMTSHKTEMINLLTAEQKKFIENRSGKLENVK